jgi:OPA family glycerol-3-phosphate transporter-like MFS transporter
MTQLIRALPPKLAAALLAVLALTPSLALAGEQKGFVEKIWPIGLLLVVIAFVIGRLPKVELGHNDAFRKRRVMNWLPLGLTYAFLYMGRYNLKVSKFAFEEMQSTAGNALMSNEGFGTIFAIGTVVYGCSFVLNGPLTDKKGGRFSILLGAAGAAVANALMGIGAWSLRNEGPGAVFLASHFVGVYSFLYALNMYFQSFGAVAIVKVNAPWFHVRERGVFGGIFGVLISLGIYFAFDIGYMILGSGDAGYPGLTWVFFTPALMLTLFWILDFFIVRNTPVEAGQADFDTEDASSGDDGPPLPVVDVFKKMLRNPIIMTIALIEFCSGFLRQAIMQWYRTFAKQTNDALGLKADFVYENWGMLLCAAGITGAVVAGIISDRLFQSRRGPVAFILYLAMLLGAVVLTFTYKTQYVGWLVVLMSLCIIGVHGMLSGTASMDFGGRKNVGVAVGIIDGFVYLGTAVMSVTYAFVLPEEQFDEAGKLAGPVLDPDNWIGWPIAMIPMALIGTLLATRVWNAKPKGKAAAH